MRFPLPPQDDVFIVEFEHEHAIARGRPAVMLAWQVAPAIRRRVDVGTAILLMMGIMALAPK